MKKVVLTVLLLGIMIPLTWILFHKYEGSAPVVDVTLPSQYLKKSYEMNLKISDHGTGLRQIMVALMQNDTEKILLDKTYPKSSLFSFSSDQKTFNQSLVIPIESRKYGMKDGEAVIRILVTDYSWRGWNNGNRFYVEKKVVIDTKPPQLRILSQQHNIEKGGTGLVIYKVFEENIKTGVMVGDNYFPGHSGLFKDPNVLASFFALSYTQGPGTQIYVTASDLAGNQSKRGFQHYIRDKKFPIDALNISQRFLERKMPDIDLEAKEESFTGSKNPLLEKFIYVNGDLRKQNVDTILAIPADTTPKLLWKGRFGRLSGAANRAGFADHRIYKHKGKEIDRAVHLGMDLASTSNAPVGAANGGRVIMAADEGIFGNTVIIDHGFGLASLYSHLSDIRVNLGDELSKGDIIGNTGLTGLAGGDHLHFSMIVHNVFVNPVEWWDGTWIKNNILSKIDSVNQGIK